MKEYTFIATIEGLEKIVEDLNTRLETLEAIVLDGQEANTTAEEADEE